MTADESAQNHSLTVKLNVLLGTVLDQDLSVQIVDMDMGTALADLGLHGGISIDLGFPPPAHLMVRLNPSIL